MLTISLEAQGTMRGARNEALLEKPKARLCVVVTWLRDSILDFLSTGYVYVSTSLDTEILPPNPDPGVPKRGRTGNYSQSTRLGRTGPQLDAKFRNNPSRWVVHAHYSHKL